MQQKLYKTQVELSESQNRLNTSQKKYYDVILVSEGLKRQIGEVQEKHKKGVTANQSLT